MFQNVIAAIKNIEKDERRSGLELLDQLRGKSKQLIKVLCLAFQSKTDLKYKVLIHLVELLKIFRAPFLLNDMLDLIFQSLFFENSPRFTSIISFLRVLLDDVDHLGYSHDAKHEPVNLYLRLDKYQHENSSAQIIEFFGKNVHKKVLDGFSSACRGDLGGSYSNMDYLGFFHRDFWFNLTKFNFNRIEKVSKYLRKFFPYFILQTDGIKSVTALVQRLITWKYKLIRKMPLKTFISITKTFLTFYEAKISYVNKQGDKSTQANDHLFSLVNQFTNFMISYFSKTEHFVYHNQTDFSLKKLDIHKKLIGDLVSIEAALKDIIGFNHKSSSDSHDLVAQKTFFNRMRTNQSRISGNYQFRRSFFENTNPIVTSKASLQNRLRGINEFIKSQANHLRSLLFSAFQYESSGEAFENHRFSTDSFQDILGSLFEVNPETALNLYTMYSN